MNGRAFIHALIAGCAGALAVHNDSLNGRAAAVGVLIFSTLCALNYGRNP